MTDWLSEIEENRPKDNQDWFEVFERMASVIRELAGYILISHRSNDPIEISLAYHNLSHDAKELEQYND